MEDKYHTPKNIHIVIFIFEIIFTLIISYFIYETYYNEITLKETLNNNFLSKFLFLFSIFVSIIIFILKTILQIKYFIITNNIKNITKNDKIALTCACLNHFVPFIPFFISKAIKIQ